MLRKIGQGYDWKLPIFSTDKKGFDDWAKAAASSVLMERKYPTGKKILYTLLSPASSIIGIVIGALEIIGGALTTAVGYAGKLFGAKHGGTADKLYETGTRLIGNGATNIKYYSKHYAYSGHYNYTCSHYNA